MKYLIAAALAAACFATSAFAADVDQDDSVTFRVEAHGGWDRVTVPGASANGAIYGVGLGVDIPVVSMVSIGFEGNADFGSTKECVNDLAIAGDRYCQKANRDLSLVAKLGFNVGSGVKLYTLGGYTNARIKETYSFGATNVSASTNGDGYRVGAGAEVKIGSSAYTKLEYRYSNYEGGYQRHQVVAGLGLGL
jgi:outer membrane immunogenic protein